MNILNLVVAAAGSAALAATKFNAAPRNLAVQAKFNYGSGGTSVDVYLQTSLDGGQSWIDIANFHFTTSSGSAIFNLSAATPKTTAVTPTDGSLAANTCVDGILGAQFRTKVVSVGTYAGNTTIALDLVTDQAA